MKNPIKNLFVLIAILFFSFRAFATDTKDWNFLVFLNGVNSLDSYGELNINQMEQIGSNDKMNIIVQWGSLERPGVQRLFIKKDADSSQVTSPVVQNMGAVDMGDWHQLVDFANWAQDQYPAKHTFLVVWNHGSGWHRPNFVIKDISSDDRTGNSISTEELGQAMQEIASHLGHKVDIYASDACLMGMVEVADQMKASVNYFIGSQDLEPGAGWPYNTFLRKWQAQPTASSIEISKMLSREYKAAYTGGIYGHDSATMSVFDLNFMDAYHQAIRSFTAEMAQMSSAKKIAVVKALQESKYFAMTDYRDMMDFTNKLMASSLIKKTGEDLKAAHDKLVIANDQNQDTMTHGLSIWLPSDLSEYKRYSQRYEDLEFNKNTKWKDFLQQLY